MGRYGSRRRLQGRNMFPDTAVPIHSLAAGHFNPLAAWLLGAWYRRAIAIQYASLPLRNRHLVLAQCERAGNGDLAPRTFVVAAPLLVVRRAHREFARGDHHHTGAFDAVAKLAAGLARIGGRLQLPLGLA